MEQNPYASPAEIQTPPPPTPFKYGDQHGLPIASTGQRFANFFIDNIVVRAIGFAVGFAIGTFLVTSNNGQPLGPDTDATIMFLDVGIGVTMTLGYFIVMEATFGKTVGKLVTGTRVVSKDGSAASFGQIVGRSFSRLIPFEAFSFLGGNGNPVGWHDSLPGTLVIRDR